MLRLIDYLAGIIEDLLFWIVKAFSYFLAGVIIVGLPLCGLAALLEWISSAFFKHTISFKESGDSIKVSAFSFLWKLLHFYIF
ncbi:hypothetical protein B0H99_10382 [Planomicrobium soli]|uniref:Uncharacterized protein n=1 Tax=Planomicrobium soli TaxID=1176648 RepID=A0A2P8H432_9BACL|nr:hypothetical protein [Planomicrobium soli]PSL40950.1 hypothetical protein B0H99_10382 [Planomicrobium soli]